MTRNKHHVVVGAGAAGLAAASAMRDNGFAGRITVVDADPLVLPGIQSRFIDARCAAGQALTYRLYAGRDHLSLVAPESPAGADLAAWTAARFAGDPAPPGCNR